MVKAELTHNPYLLQTTVLFNGQSPKINSQIEKYASQPFKDWVHKVPGIFYDEMNGYDFDLYFTGTVSDFEELRSAFAAAGVSQEQVRLIYKNEIEDSIKKSAEVDNLLEWLRQNPNRRFDYDMFWEKNIELFEGSYPLIIMGGFIPEKMEMSISPEPVDTVQELTNTDLSSTPIVFIIKNSNREQVRMDLNSLLCRSDIHQNQLFFMIDPALEVSQVIRVISDLGVTNPQIIKSVDDEAVLGYVKNYPVIEYVRSVIDIVSEMTEQIGEDLNQEKRKSIKTNEAVYRDIEIIDAEIARLKVAWEQIAQRDYYRNSQKTEIVRQELISQLRKWRNRKTKIVGEHDAQIAANDYQHYIEKIWESFLKIINSGKNESVKDIDRLFSQIYKRANIDIGFQPKGIALSESNHQYIPNMIPVFLAAKTRTFEEAKTDFLGLFRKTSEETDKQVSILTYDLEEWRAKAVDYIRSVADALIHDYYVVLSDYYNTLAEKYHEHLVNLISERVRSKSIISAQLSGEEKRLQNDMDWLANVKDQLLMIERA